MPDATDIRVLFMGRKPVAKEALSWLHHQQSIRIVGAITNEHLGSAPAREFAQAAGIPVLSREEAEERILSGNLCVDLALSLFYWQKIRRPLLESCPLGVINFHPSPLPDYKGMGGYSHAILNGLKQWAISAHYVDAEIDTGPLIEVAYFPIDALHETAQTLELKSQQQALALFKRTISRILNCPGPLPCMPNVGGQYTDHTTMEALKEIKPGDDVLRKIRAFWCPPYEGAYVVVNGVRCTLVSSEILQALHASKLG